MNAGFVAVFAHSLERIIAVSLGGLAVYYGFRLFLVVPLENHSDGKIRLPGVSVVLAKAGPGLFFAAFGALVIIMSLLRPVKVGSDVSGESTYLGATDVAAPAVRDPGPQHPGPQPRAPRQGSPEDLARIRLTIQTLNCMQELSTSGPRKLPATEAELAIRDAKLALLQGSWDERTLGDFEAFRKWVIGSGDTTGAAKMLFQDNRTDCPR